MVTIPGRHVRTIKPEEKNKYETLGDSLTVESKLAILRELGREDMIEIFKEYKPRKVRARRSAPLDQRINLLLSQEEKALLENEVRALKSQGENVSLAQLIRSKSLSSIDLVGWREKAEEAFKNLEEIKENEAELKKQRGQLVLECEEESNGEGEADNEDIVYLQKKIMEIDRKLGKLMAKKVTRSVRLSGRMTMVEAETIKWRANRLCISTSDYLRFMIFGRDPDSNADAHLSYDAKRRFYISIIDVANNGWGDPPSVYQCSQCAHYLEQMEKLEARVHQLETFKNI